jgi:hypothetical protein
MPSNVAIILDLIRREPGLTDSEIRQRTGIDPHQQVNGICNRLAKDGRIRRQRGPRGQWVNLPSDAGRTIRSPDTSMHPTVAARERDALARRSPGYTPPLGPWGAYPMLSVRQPRSPVGGSQVAPPFLNNYRRIWRVASWTRAARSVDVRHGMTYV